MSEFSLYNEIAKGLKEAISYERGESNACTTIISYRLSESSEWAESSVRD